MSMGIQEDKKPGSPKKPWIYYYTIVMIVTLLLNLLVVPWMTERSIVQVGYNDFLKMVNNKEITWVVRGDDQLTFGAENDKGKEVTYKTGTWPDAELVQRLESAGVNFYQEIPQKASPFVSFIMTWIMPILMFVIIGQLMGRMMQKRMGGSNAMTFGKSNAKIYAESETHLQMWPGKRRRRKP